MMAMDKMAVEVADLENDMQVDWADMVKMTNEELIGQIYN